MIIKTCLFLLFSFALSQNYEPTWDSLDKRPLPTWYDEVKFGIFMHWGVFSVPSLDDAWFWWYWRGDKPDPKVVAFMAKNYPPEFTYADFGAQFTNELWVADIYAEIIQKSGAK